MIGKEFFRFSVRDLIATTGQKKAFSRILCANAPRWLPWRFQRISHGLVCIKLGGGFGYFF
jgi:hypothetical protein